MLNWLRLKRNSSQLVWRRLLSGLLSSLLSGIVSLSLILEWGIRPAIATPLNPTLAQSSSTNLVKAPDARTGKSMQPYFDRVIQNVTEFTLENGLKFIVLERHQAPIISFMTYADVGGADEPEGLTGMAHFLEHLAFKGTPRIGTNDFKQEKLLLERMDAIGAKLQQAEREHLKLMQTYRPDHPAVQANLANIQTYKTELDALEAKSQPLVRQNEYGRIVEQAGGSGLNANTSADATRYFYSFPSNKLELWMSLESERFLEPVFREFYKEKQVILEERRMRTENSPIGQLIEAYLPKAFSTHPYKRPVIGYVDDLQRITRQDVQTFFDTYYTPNNLTIAIVGDVNPTQVKQLAQTYFGRFAKRPKPPQVTVVEPPQKQTQEITLKLASEPIYLEGYHRPAKGHPDAVVYDAIASILSDGRTSRLYRKLVEQEKIALNAQSFNGFPGDKFPNLIMFYGLTAPGHRLEEIATALHEELNRLVREPVSATELNQVKTQARAALLRSLDSNSGMAEALLEYQAKTGNWRNLFKELDAIAAITPADIQRVAKATFTPENRTVGRILPK